MVDMEMYRKLHDSYSDFLDVAITGIGDSLPFRVPLNGPIPENKLVLQLMSPFVFGFNMLDKKWRKSGQAVSKIEA